MEELIVESRSAVLPAYNSPPMARLLPRLILDFLVSISAIAAFVLWSKSGSVALGITIGLALLVAAGLAGYREPAAKWVVIHPIVMMSPELTALPVVLVTCRGFECQGFVAFLAIASWRPSYWLASHSRVLRCGESQDEPGLYPDTRDV